MPDVGAWLATAPVLFVVLPVNATLSRYPEFWLAHGLPAAAWLPVELVAVALLWGAVSAALLAARYTCPDGWHDVAWMVIAVVVALVIGALLVAGVPAQRSGHPFVLSLLLASGIAAGIAWLPRRFAGGRVVLLCAVGAAAIPLIFASSVSAAPVARQWVGTTSEGAPDVVWVIADDLGADIVLDENGAVRDGLPNLARLQSHATTFSQAFSPANYTEMAVPAMLSGIADAVDWTKRYGGVPDGVLEGLASELLPTHDAVIRSPLGRYDCRAGSCTWPEGQGATAWDRISGTAGDVVAIAGGLLPVPLSSGFPSPRLKIAEFWSDTKQASRVEDVARAISGPRFGGRPLLAVWHTITTHAPWVVDERGLTMMSAQTPLVDGSLTAGSDANGAPQGRRIAELSTRLYEASALEFDRELGEVLDAIDNSGRADRTMIVVTADHGEEISSGWAHPRLGRTDVETWRSVAHVPMLVAYPGQHWATVVSEPRSVAQAASSVLLRSGLTPMPDAAPALDRTLPGGPVFADATGGNAAPVPYPGPVWRTASYASFDPHARNPFAVGVDPGLLGRPLADDATEVDVQDEWASVGTSMRQLLRVSALPIPGCADPSGVSLVTVSGTVESGVLWEDSVREDGLLHGWAVIPKGDDVRVWCDARIRTAP